MGRRKGFWTMWCYFALDRSGIDGENMRHISLGERQMHQRRQIAFDQKLQHLSHTEAVFECFHSLSARNRYSFSLQATSFLA